jgi:hypothetical protein
MHVLRTLWSLVRPQCLCYALCHDALFFMLGSSNSVNMSRYQDWTEPYTYSVYTVFLAVKSPNIWSYTVYIRFRPTLYIRCIYGVLGREIT